MTLLLSLSAGLDLPACAVEPCEYNVTNQQDEDFCLSNDTGLHCATGLYYMAIYIIIISTRVLRRETARRGDAQNFAHVLLTLCSFYKQKN